MPFPGILCTGMVLKKYVRKGVFDECRSYKPLGKLEGRMPTDIIMLLEGKCRRKIQLTNNRHLYENYYPTSFIGLEDYVLRRGRLGAIGMYPGSHYVIWDGEDFMSALGIQPELARRAIFELSRRIRIYDAHKKSTEALLKVERHIDIGAPQAELSDTLYEMSFADDDNFPPHLVEKLTVKFQDGEALMRQGELTSDLYIILTGKVQIYQTYNHERRLIDTCGEGQMIGEMAQFDSLPRSADGIAQGTVEALAFSPENFHLLFQLHPRWSRQLLETLAERVTQRLRTFETIDLEELRVPEETDSGGGDDMFSKFDAF